MFNKPRNMIWKRGKASTFVRTTFGSKEFPPDVEVLVPPRLVQAALAIGIEFVDDDEKLPEIESKDPEPIDPESREIAIEEAINIIVARAKKDPKKYREDFTAGNSPRLVVIAEVAGLKRVGAHEVNAVFGAQNEALETARMKQEKAKAEKATAKKTGKKTTTKKPKPGVTDESGAEDR